MHDTNIYKSDKRDTDKGSNPVDDSCLDVFASEVLAAVLHIISTPCREKRSLHDEPWTGHLLRHFSVI